MLNLDWFQPFDSTSHSTGVLYAAICNLPRNIRFKRENLLIISILPGPNEVSLHKINHYLAPMVDELESLWNGILNRTYEYREGRQIRAALILISCDIPAARKICGHISALAACHRCEKRGNYENHQHNFAGMHGRYGGLVHYPRFVPASSECYWVATLQFRRSQKSICQANRC